MAGSRSLGTLTVDLVAKIGGFEQGLDKAGRALDSNARKMNKIASGIGTAIGVGITAGAAAFGALSLAMKASIDRMDELSKAAQRASLPTEQFTQLAYAGDLADVSVEDLTKSLGKLAKAQGDAQLGLKTQKDAFDQLGIAYANANGSLRNTRDVFLDFADAFQKYKGSPEVVAAGMQIFGRSFQNLIPLLKDGRKGLQDAAEEADRLGITLSGSAGRQAEEFNDNLTRLHSSITGLTNVITARALPKLVEFTDLLTDPKNQKAIRDIATALGDVAAKAIEFSGRILEAAASYRQWLADAGRLPASSLDSVDQLETRIKKLSEMQYGTGVLADIRRGVFGDKISSELKKAIAERNGFKFRGVQGGSSSTYDNTPTGEIPLITPPSPSGGKSDAQREAEQLEAAYQRLMDSQREEIALFGKTGEAAKVRYEIEFGDLKALSDAKKQDLIANAERLDQMKTEKELQDAADEAVRRETEAYKQHSEQVQQTIADMQFELSLYDMTNIQREKAIALRYANVDAMSEEGQQIAELAGKIYQASKANEVWQEAQRSLSDAMFDSISGAKSLKDAFLDLVDNIERAILRSITDNWAEQIGNWFKGAAGSSAQSSGGSGVNWGAIIGSLFGGGKASGGGVQAGGMYRVAEYRPEVVSVGSDDYLVMGSKSGHVTPKPAFGGGSVNQSIYVTGVIDPRSAAQLQQEAAMRQRIATARS